MKCITCGAELSKDRENAIIFLSKEHIPTCLEHADNTKKRAIFQGISGISPMIFVDKISDEKPIWHETEPDTLKDFSYSLSDEE
jgi:hypothetical protein